MALFTKTGFGPFGPTDQSELLQEDRCRLRLQHRERAGVAAKLAREAREGFLPKRGRRRPYSAARMFTPNANFSNDCLNLTELCVVSDKDSPTPIWNTLNGLSQLKELILGCPAVTDAGLEPLAGLKKLKTLAFVSAKITDAGLPRLEALENLDELWLSDTKVTDGGLERLRRLTKLRRLLPGKPGRDRGGYQEASAGDAMVRHYVRSIGRDFACTSISISTPARRRNEPLVLLRQGSRKMGTGSVAQTGAAPGETMPPRCLSPFSAVVVRRKRGQAPSPEAVLSRQAALTRRRSQSPFSTAVLRR